MTTSLTQKQILAIFGLVVAALLFASAAFASNGPEKVEICHKGKNTLSVAAPAVAAHLAHGDTLGACGSDGGGGGPIGSN